MTNLHGCRVQANSHRSLGVVQTAVVGASQDHIVHVVAGNRSRHQRAHQQPRDRGIAVRKMKNIRLFFFYFPQIQAVEAGIGERFVIVAILETRESRNRINTHAEQVMRISLENGSASGLSLQTLVR